LHQAGIRCEECRYPGPARCTMADDRLSHRDQEHSDCYNDEPRAKDHVISTGSLAEQIAVSVPQQHGVASNLRLILEGNCPSPNAPRAWMTDNCSPSTTL
jgi:hypothetical protein